MAENSRATLLSCRAQSRHPARHSASAAARPPCAPRRAVEKGRRFLDFARNDTSGALRLPQCLTLCRRKNTLRHGQARRTTTRTAFTNGLRFRNNEDRDAGDRFEKVDRGESSVVQTAG